MPGEASGPRPRSVCHHSQMFSHQGTPPPRANLPTRQLNTFAGLTLGSSHWGDNIVPVFLVRPPVLQAGCWCQGDATKAGFLEAVGCGAQMWALE